MIKLYDWNGFSKLIKDIKKKCRRKNYKFKRIPSTEKI